ncbi:MAG: hypothetical protein GX572_05300 [Clostridia bacterium]|nr:hypothetical protein [Clostridia bacterium]
MNPCELTMSITAIANALAKEMSDEQLELAAAAFSQLGDTLATIAASRSLCGPRQD